MKIASQPGERKPFAIGRYAAKVTAFTKIADGNIFPVTAPTDTLTAGKYNWYADDNADYLPSDIAKISGGNIGVTGINGGDYTNIDNAVVYQLYLDGATWKLKASKVSSIKKATT